MYAAAPAGRRWVDGRCAAAGVRAPSQAPTSLPCCCPHLRRRPSTPSTPLCEAGAEGLRGGVVLVIVLCRSGWMSQERVWPGCVSAGTAPSWMNGTARPMLCIRHKQASLLRHKVTSVRGGINSKHSLPPLSPRVLHPPWCRSCPLLAAHHSRLPPKRCTERVCGKGVRVCAGKWCVCSERGRHA